MQPDPHLNILLILSAPQFLHNLLPGALKRFSNENGLHEDVFFLPFIFKVGHTVMLRRLRRWRDVRRNSFYFNSVFLVSLFYKNYENKNYHCKG